MSQASLSIAGRRLFLRNGGTAALSGAAAVLLAGREALAQSATLSQTDLHNSAPTQFQEVGDVRLAYRRFGKEGAPPLVCLQHFTGRMDNWDPTRPCQATHSRRHRSVGW
jgi:hypothetical protein